MSAQVATPLKHEPKLFDDSMPVLLHDDADKFWAEDPKYYVRLPKANSMTRALDEYRAFVKLIRESRHA